MTISTKKLETEMALCMTQPSSFRNQDAIRFYIILQFFHSTKFDSAQ